MRRYNNDSTSNNLFDLNVNDMSRAPHGNTREGLPVKVRTRNRSWNSLRPKSFHKFLEIWPTC